MRPNMQGRRRGRSDSRTSERKRAAGTLGQNSRTFHLHPAVKCGFSRRRSRNRCFNQRWPAESTGTGRIIDLRHADPRPVRRCYYEPLIVRRIRVFNHLNLLLMQNFDNPAINDIRYHYHVSTGCIHKLNYDRINILVIARDTVVSR